MKELRWLREEPKSLGFYFSLFFFLFLFYFFIMRSLFLVIRSFVQR